MVWQPDARTLRRIYLVRHGRTALNARGALRGRLDPPLDRVGRDEAQALAGVLGGLAPSAVVASPLLRAVETANFIATVADLSVEVETRMIDRDYGPWSGMAAGQIEDQWGTLDEAPGVEPLPALDGRVRAAFEGLTARLIEPSRIVVVAHDIVNRSLIAMIDPDRFPARENVAQRTGCYNILDLGVAGWRVTGVDILPPSSSPPEHAGV